MLSEMLDFFKRLLVAIPNSCFLFITPDKPEWIKEEVAKRGIDPEKNIRVVNAQYREVPGYLSCSNISIFFIKPTFSKSASSPTKQAEILAVGIPIICNAGIGDTDSIILDSKAGAVIQSFSTEEYERVIGMIPSLLKIPPSEIRKYALSHLSLESAVEKYAEVYELVG